MLIASIEPTLLNTMKSSRECANHVSSRSHHLLHLTMQAVIIPKPLLFWPRSDFEPTTILFWIVLYAGPMRVWEDAGSGAGGVVQCFDYLSMIVSLTS